MKKLLFTLAIAISSIAVFANEETTNTTVLKEFKKDFPAATDVQWSHSTDFYKATFELNKQYISAFYTPEGEFIGTTRNITSVNLPLALQLKIRNDYNNYWIADLLEVSNSNGTTYYLTIQDADKQLVLKSEGTSQWSTYKKTTRI